MSLVDLYISTRENVQKQHGPRTIVLLENGSFFEMIQENEDTCVTCASEIAKLLDIRLTKKNKSIMKVDKSNPLLLGFPSYVLEKYLKILVQNDYTVALITQTTPPPNPQRKLTRVVSKSTWAEDQTEQTPKLMTVFVEDTSPKTTVYGISLIDLFDGVGYITETTSMDFLLTWCKVYSPAELVIFGNTNNLDFKNWLTENPCVKNEISPTKSVFESITYQDKMLRTVFGECGLLNPLDYIDPALNNMKHGVTSYVRLLQFVYDHDENILKNIPHPKVQAVSNVMQMNQGVLNHLNIIGTKHSEPELTLMKLLNVCVTSMGRRLFHHRMTNPCTSGDVITRRLELVSGVLSSGLEKITETRKVLGGIYDIQKLARKCGQGRLSAKDIVQLLDSIQKTQELRTTHLTSFEICDMTFTLEMLDHFDTDNLLSGSGNPFKEGCFPEIDDALKTLKKCEESITLVLTEFNNQPGGNIFKMEKSEKEGYYLTTTTRRWNEFLKTQKEITVNGNVIDLKRASVRQLSTNVKITFEYLDNLFNQMCMISQRIQISVDEKMGDFKSRFSKEESQLQKLGSSIAEMDVIYAHALNAHTMRLAKPELVADNTSGVQMFNLRHLIVERVNGGVPYVGNDVCLKTDGIVLYGLNAAGKSTLMKSIGLAVIMAQSGSYVACDKMILCPYEKIYTRIGLSDDIYKNYSTFVSEMLELKQILENADPKTMVLGDELCSSTEFVSALSIVGAAISHLHDVGASFVFASHLHELVKMDVIQSLERIRIQHLSVRYDGRSGSLIYERKLQDGPGSDTYGIEVLKSIMKDIKFLKKAETIRKQVTKTNKSLVDTKKSRYNAKHLTGTKCEICGSSERKVEVHHIKPQKDADAEGYIDSFHKNDLHNLITICEACHDDIHSNKLMLKGYVSTTRGKQVVFG